MQMVAAAAAQLESAMVQLVAVLVAVVLLVLVHGVIAVAVVLGHHGVAVQRRRARQNDGNLRNTMIDDQKPTVL